MRLLVDIGNSRLKWTLCGADGTLGTVAATPHDPRALAEHLDSHWRPLAPPDDVWIGSVSAANVVETLETWIAEHWHVPAYRARAAAQGFGVTNGYRDPAQLGVDRWLAMVGARAMGLAPVCIADCGTALTLDVLSDDGLHHGGLIGPGLRLSRRSLATGTHALFESPGVESVGLAYDTGSAIRAGTLRALAALIAAVYRDDVQRRYPSATLVLTGGDAATVAPFIDSPVKLVPDLVLRGLAVVAGSQP